MFDNTSNELDCDKYPSTAGVMGVATNNDAFVAGISAKLSHKLKELKAVISNPCGGKQWPDWMIILLNKSTAFGIIDKYQQLIPPALWPNCHFFRITSTIWNIVRIKFMIQKQIVHPVSKPWLEMIHYQKQLEHKH